MLPIRHQPSLSAIALQPGNPSNLSERGASETVLDVDAGFVLVNSQLLATALYAKHPQVVMNLC